jgi:hypothetical protein
LPREVAQLFAELRRTGNSANHAMLGDQITALYVLKICKGRIPIKRNENANSGVTTHD